MLHEPRQKGRLGQLALCIADSTKLTAAGPYGSSVAHRSLRGPKRSCLIITGQDIALHNAKSSLEHALETSSQPRWHVRGLRHYQTERR